MKKRGIFFSIDALVALIIIFLSILIVYPLIKYTPEKDFVQEDILKVFSSIKVGEIDNAYIQQLITDGNITDLNKSVLEQIGEFYVTDLAISKAIAESVISDINERENIGIWYGNKLLASKNITSIENSTNVKIARRVISGIKEGESVTGFSSRAYLQNNMRTKYFYFGGYVGEGNISAQINYTGVIDNAKIEITSNKDFDVYINDIYSGHYANSSDDFTPSEYYLGAYEANFQSGENIIKFAANGLHIAGGYIRITYTDGNYFGTNQKRYYFPGIQGLINLYDGFYIPNALNQMKIFLHMNTDYTTFLTIGNTTIFKNKTTGEQTITINNTELSSKLNYLDLVNKTIPLRLGLENVSYEVNYTLNADVVSVTDLSGSMGWETGKLDDAKDANKVLIDNVLNVSGNKVGLVGYRSSVSDSDSHELSNDSVSLKSGVDSWYASGGTCICCGINKAIDYLKGINIVQEKEYWNVTNQTYVNWTKIDFDDSLWESKQMPGFAYQYYNKNITKENISIAIMGDYNNQIENLLINQGFSSVTSYAYNAYNSIILDIDNFNVIILNRVSNEAGFDNLLQEAKNNGIGILFLSGWYYTSYGAGVLNQRTGNPSTAYTNYLYFNDVKITKETNHPILENYSIGEEITIISGATYNMYGRYTDYSGNTIAKHNSENVIGVDEIEKHVLMGFGADYYTNVNHWTIDAKQIFEKTILWAGKTQSYFPEDEWYLRKSFNLVQTPSEAKAYIYIDDKAEVYLNEELIYNATQDYNGSYWNNNFTIDINKFNIGKNVIATKLINNDNSSGGFDFKIYVEFQDRYKSMIVMSDGWANGVCPEQGTGNADNDAIQAACDAYNNYEIIVHAVGFGSGADEATLQAIATCGNGSYYLGDLGNIVDIYKNISTDIIKATYSKQTIKTIGNITTILYPDSYIEFNFTEKELPYGLILNPEKQFTDSSTGIFDLPPESQVIDTKVISYSGPRWTDSILINNITAYNLSIYGSAYTKLGDPYHINIPLELVNDSNIIKLTTGLSSENSSGGSVFNKIIYKIVKNATSYSPISASAEGCSWTIDFEDNTNLTLKIPYNYTGENICYYQDNREEYNENDALERAAYYLLQQLDFDLNGKADVKFLEQDLVISSSEIVGIPFGWSTEVQVRKWH